MPPLWPYLLPQSVAIDPRYASRKSKEYVTAGEQGLVQLSSQVMGGEQGMVQLSSQVGRCNSCNSCNNCYN